MKNLKVRYIVSITRRNGIKGAIAGLLSLCGPVGNAIIWRVFERPMQVTMPGMDFFADQGAEDHFSSISRPSPALDNS